MTSSHQRMTQWTARVLLLAALALTLSASRGQAGCGDHVQFGPQAGRSQDHESAPSGPLPCHGPTCSGHQPQPMPPGAPARVVPPEDLRQTSADSFAHPQRSLDRVVSGACFLPHPSVSSIFHPPR
jgi:hypothetical protein